MQILPDVAPQSISPDVARTLDALPNLALFRVLANASGAFSSWVGLSAALLSELELDAGLREIAILQLAKTVQSEYEWAQHTAIARTVGATTAVIDAIERGSVDDLDPRHALVARAATEMASGDRVTAANVMRLRDELGVRATVELLLVLGHYLAIARLVASVEIEPEAPDHVVVPAPSAS